MSKVCEIKLN